MGQESVRCVWNKQGTPELNYTFRGWFVTAETVKWFPPFRFLVSLLWQINPSSLLRFFEKNETECPRYLSENHTRVGCIQPYTNRDNRFFSFYTKLQLWPIKEHDLKSKGRWPWQEPADIQKGDVVLGRMSISFPPVKLNPPFNLTVKVGPDSNLWYYWNQTDPCEENEVRYRINNREWDVSQRGDHLSQITRCLLISHLGCPPQNSIISSRSCCINLPSNTSLYELQVRGRMSADCGQSVFWSDWSKPVLWGSNNSTVKTGKTSAALHRDDERSENEGKSSLSEPPQDSVLTSRWNLLLYCSGVLILILLIVMLQHCERWVNPDGWTRLTSHQDTGNTLISQQVVETVVLWEPKGVKKKKKGVYFSHRVRFILLPVVPKPSFSSYDIQVRRIRTDWLVLRLISAIPTEMLFSLSKDWLSHSKGLNESFKPNYNERPCPVREYCPVSQPDWLDSVWTGPSLRRFWWRMELSLVFLKKYIYIHIYIFYATISDKDHKTWLLFKKFSQVIFLYMLLLCFFCIFCLLLKQFLNICISVKLGKNVFK